MEVIYFLVPLGLMFLGIAIWSFFWAVKHDQFDDMDSPSHRILQDDREERRKKNNECDGLPRYCSPRG
jgi:cbb3-type cytochrome oxidase maturation protein